MSPKLKIRVAKDPNPEAVVSARQKRPSKRLLREVFGTTRPRQKMAIIIPGEDTTDVQVCIQDQGAGDLTALAEALGVLGGDVQ